MENILINYKSTDKESSKNTKNNRQVQYEEKLKEYNVGIIENIKLAFDSATDFLGKLAHDIDNISSFKMFILCLNNGLELLFKYMISNRNEYMLYMDNSKDKIYSKYKKAKENNYTRLSVYFEYNPMEDNLHTISFSEACKVLCYVYQIDEFDDLFFTRCMELSKVRNSLTHYSAIIRKIDIISFCDILDTAIEWFNKEIENHYIDLSILMKDNNNMKYTRKENLMSDINRACSEAIDTEILDDDLCKQIIGFIIENSDRKLIEVSSNDYEKISSMFFESNKGKTSLKKKMASKFIEKYYIMVLANMIVEKGIKASHHEDAPEVMSRLDLNDWVYSRLINKWPVSDDQKKNLGIDKSIHEIYSRYDDEMYLF
ncbi:hypothetical protein [Tepidibacter mesophilus]|uniref:hypothetical protein n=1 Tax=Tepidibacter mesophilus TaxID=655607 RepID=UPI000C071C1E|nr:hypothetical protein [Tepidibacter mesophilus]